MKKINNFKQFLMVLLAFVFVGVNQAWGGQAHVYAYSSPAAGGYVYVATSNAEPGAYSKTKDDAEQGGFMGSGNKTFYLFYKANAGYLFKNWYKTNESNYNNATTVTNTSNLTSQGQSVTQSATGIGAQNSYYAAVFTPINYYFAFHGNGSTSGEMTNQTFTYDAAQNIKANAFARQYSITYDADGGECAETGATVSYTFEGWSNAAGGAVAYANSQSIKNLTTVANKVFDVYAVWNGNAVVLPMASREGFLFDGWYNGDTWIGNAGDSYLATADIELTAHWAQKYTPMFVLDKDEIELEQTTKLSFTNVANPSVQIAPEGIVSYNAETGILTALALGEVTITITQEETDYYIYKQETLNLNVIRKSPSLSVILNGVEQSSVIIYQGTKTTVSFNKISDAEVVVSTVSGGEHASYANGVITAGEIGTAVFRATLPQTDTYQSIYVDFEVEVQRDPRHLPLTMTGAIWNNSEVKVASEGSNSWDNSRGAVLGDAGGGGFDWDDKYFVLHFNGIPQSLTFEIATYATGMGATLGGATNVEWYVQESATDEFNDSKVWTGSHDGTSFSATQTVELQPNTRYVKLCYSGNFAGCFRNVKISELKYVQDPEPANIDFGSAIIYTGEVSKTVNVNWCNIAPMTVTSSNPRFSVSPSFFGNYDQMNSQEITITYTHTGVVGANEADITISNDNNVYTKTIHVSAETTKRTQRITWNADLEATGFAMNVGEQFPDTTIPVVATTPNGERIILSSSNSDIIEVIADTALLAKAVGTVEITAYQAGNAEYEEATDTKEFTVTLLQKQTITWEQNLYGLLTTSQPLVLTATATSGMPITYESANTNVVRIEDGTLVVVGEGETTITATQEGGVDDGGTEWLAISQENYVIVRNPASQCNEMALSVASLTLKESSLSKEYVLDGTPTSLTFSAKHGKKDNGAWGQGPTYAALMVDEYTKVDGVWGWKNIYNTVVGTDATASGTLNLDEIATKVRFRTTETGIEHTISNIRIPRMKYMRSDVSVIDFEVESNAIWQQTITVSHSNIDLMTVTAKQGLISINTNTLGGGCGSFGDDQFTVTFTPMQKYVHYYDTIVITDGKAQPSTITIPVHLYSKGLNQTIEGFVVPETAMTTDEIAPFSATATSGLPVAYSTSDETIARIVNDSVLEIVTAGTVEIYAIQAGNEKYDSTAVAKTLVVSKVAATIQTLPQVAEITYGQTLAEATLTDGAGSVEGTFAWADATIVPEAGEHAYMVVFTPANEAWYEGASELLTVSVAKVDAAVETAPIAVANLAYTGEPQVLIEAGQAAGGTLLYSLDGENYADTLPTGVEVGEYTIYYMVAGDANHNDVPAATVTAVISGDDAVLLVAPVAFDTLVYNGEPQVLIEAGEAEGGTLLYSLGDIDHFADTLPTAVEVGEYKIYYYVAGDENHSNTLLDSLSVAIAPEEPVLTPQTITWEWDADNDTIEVEDQVYIDVYATSNMEVTITISDETKAVLMDNWLNALAAGTITVTATQDGNDVWAAAEPVVHQITIIDPNAQTEPDPQITTAVDELEAKSAVTKIIRDNQLLIIRDNRTYTATGLLVE